jgi:COP9 signalosome complex subunit 6
MVIMNVTDHLTRVRQQVDPKASEVFGVLYGRQKGMQVEVLASFEMKYSPLPDGGIEMDKAFVEGNIGLSEQACMCCACPVRADGAVSAVKEVFQDYELVGWYGTGVGLRPSLMRTHRDIMTYNDNPVFVHLDPNIEEGQKDIPLAAFESVFVSTEAGHTLAFNELESKIEASDAETITLDAVSQTKPDAPSDSDVVHPYHKLVESLTRLEERVGVLIRYLEGVKDGSIDPNPRLLRLVSDVVARVPTADGEMFRTALLDDFGDTLLLALVASMTRGTASLESLVSRVEVLETHRQRSNFGSVRRPPVM